MWIKDTTSNEHGLLAFKMGYMCVCVCVWADDYFAEIQSQGRLADEGWSEQFAGESTPPSFRQRLTAMVSVG